MKRYRVGVVSTISVASSVGTNRVKRQIRDKGILESMAEPKLWRARCVWIFIAISGCAVPTTENAEQSDNAAAIARQVSESLKIGDIGKPRWLQSAELAGIPFARCLRSLTNKTSTAYSPLGPSVIESDLSADDVQNCPEIRSGLSYDEWADLIHLPREERVYETPSSPATLNDRPVSFDGFYLKTRTNFLTFTCEQTAQRLGWTTPLGATPQTIAPTAVLGEFEQSSNGLMGEAVKVTVEGDVPNDFYWHSYGLGVETSDYKRCYRADDAARWGSLSLPAQTISQHFANYSNGRATRGIKGYHSGTDFSIGAFQPVNAIAFGKVVKIGVIAGAGGYTIVAHPDGTFAAYLHCSKRAPLGGRIPVEGEFVEQGGFICFPGTVDEVSTRIKGTLVAYITAPHVHAVVLCPIVGDCILNGMQTFGAAYSHKKRLFVETKTNGSESLRQANGASTTDHYYALVNPDTSRPAESYDTVGYYKDLIDYVRNNSERSIYDVSYWPAPEMRDLTKRLTLQLVKKF